MSFLQDISYGTWVGKDVFQLPQWLLNATGSPEEWFLGLPVVRDLVESVVKIRHAFEDLRVHATESGQELLGMSGTILDTLKSFVETAHAINRAFNSKVHPNPTGTGNRELARLRVNNNEVRLYKKTLLVNNKDSVKIGRDLSRFTDRISPAMQGIISAREQMTLWEDRAANRLAEMLNDARNRVQSETGRIKQRTQRLIRNIQRVLGLSGANRELESAAITGSLIQERAIVLVPPVATGVVPSVMGTVAMIQAIATMLLSSFNLVGLPATGISALSLATTATALKALGSAGANACRYLCAGALKAIPVSFIPRVFSHTTMFAGAWSFIGAWSLPIIIAAIVIVILIKSRLDEVIGEEVLIFAEVENTSGNPLQRTEPDMLYARIEVSEDLDIRQYLTLSAEDLVWETGKNYENIYGFTLEDGDITLSFLLNDFEPVKVSNTNFARFAMYADSDFY